MRQVRVAHPAETVLACARDLALLDVVLIGDAALHAGDATTADLLEVSRLRRRGAPLLRRAIPLMDARSESIFETLLRMLHATCSIGVDVQPDLLDDAGTFVARADLVLSGTCTLHECDGGEHRTPRRHERDLRRERRLLRAGYTRRGYTPRDILTRPADIIRDADVTLRRAHDPTSLQPWYALLRDSLFTASGQRRLVRKLGLAAETADEVAG
ncbi:MAG: hypothetical protein QM747_02880 [Nocardioides sp.]